MILLEEDETNPFEDFLLIAGFEDFGATKDDLEAIIGSEWKLEEQSMEEKDLKRL